MTRLCRSNNVDRMVRDKLIGSSATFDHGIKRTTRQSTS
jgi:hypothetical protein